jgi:L-2,4-diaminobutyric acid acetyltransferase
MTDMSDVSTNEIKALWRSPQPKQTKKREKLDIAFRRPTADDGPGIWQVVKDSGVLDVNSPYAYSLMAWRFADTCVVAEHQDQVVGFVTGFRPPKKQDVIFVWQIGVHEIARGQGLAKRILLDLVRRPGCNGVRFMETTITPSNKASRNLFRSFARKLDADVRILDGLDPEHLTPETQAHGHEPEELFRIGPFAPTGRTLD